MSIKHTEDFKLEAVRIALSRGLPRAQIAGNLGVGKSTLSKWISVYRLHAYSGCPAGGLGERE